MPDNSKLLIILLFFMLWVIKIIWLWCIFALSRIFIHSMKYWNLLKISSFLNFSKLSIFRKYKFCGKYYNLFDDCFYFIRLSLTEHTFRRNQINFCLKYGKPSSRLNEDDWLFELNIHPFDEIMFAIVFDEIMAQRYKKNSENAITFAINFRLFDEC